MEMRQQESDRSHISAAREVLEKALVWQVREITRGLLAHELFRCGNLSVDQWLQQYIALEDNLDFRKAVEETTMQRFFETATMLARNLAGESAVSGEQTAPRTGTPVPQGKPPFEPTEDQAFQSFRQTFYVDVAQRRIQPIKPAGLAKCTLRIYGGTVPFWCEGRVNRQLADLGSSLRLFVLGSDLMRLQAISAALGKPVDGPTVGIFILGDVRPCTVLGKATLFEFVTEYAVSPLLDPKSPALTDQCRIVTRSSLAAIPSFIRWSFPMSHEWGHILQDYPPETPGDFSSWKAIVREDICRFAQIPRTRDEISESFTWNLAGPVALFDKMFPLGESPESLDTILAGLCNDELLRVVTGNRYFCDRFSDGRTWPLI